MTKARMPFAPDDIRNRPVRRFESLARRDTTPGPPVNPDDHDMQRVISLGQIYMQLDRGSRDGNGELSDMEVEAMVVASEYVNGRRRRGGQVWYATQ